MLRFVFAFTILVHGLIHILGFIKEFQLAKVTQLSGKTLIPLPPLLAKTSGFLWLFACLLFFITFLYFLLKKDEWWIYGVIGILCSQTLIIIHWQDAKFGTIANLIILLAVIISYANWQFNFKVKKELNYFQPQLSSSNKIINEEMVQSLPRSVQKWLHRSNIVGREMIRTVHLKQKGEMRTKPTTNWMEVSAEQYFTLDPPGFIWIADVEAAPYIHLYGMDIYKKGHGFMQIKLLSLFTVADAKGKETDQGTLLRYLAETVWFPHAALSSYITWQEIDSTTAKATMSYGGTTASGIFIFNQYGDVLSFEALRYYDRPEKPTLEKWFISNDENSYKDFGGIRIPSKSEVTWKLKTGDFTWFKLEITDIQHQN